MAPVAQKVQRNPVAESTIRWIVTTSATRRANGTRNASALTLTAWVGFDDSVHRTVDHLGAF